MTQVREGREVTILEKLEATLVCFVQQPDWHPEAVAPEDNADWRAGYEAALGNLREELKPWWPFAGEINLAPDGPEASALIRDLVAALGSARSALEHIEPDALGMATVPPRGDDDFGYEYPIRDELLSKIGKALSKVKPLSSPLGSDTDG